MSQDAFTETDQTQPGHKKVKTAITILSIMVVFLIVLCVIIIILMYNTLTNQKLTQAALVADSLRFADLKRETIQTNNMNYLALNDKQDTTVNYIKKLLRKPSLSIRDIETIVNASGDQTRSAVLAVLSEIKMQQDSISYRTGEQLKEAAYVKVENANLQNKVSELDDVLKRKSENYDRMLKVFFNLAEEHIQQKQYEDAKFILLKLQSTRLEKSYNDIATIWINQCDEALKTSGFWNKLTGKGKKPELTKPQFEY
jgi:flagellar basal body-associated protein FliL